LRLAPESLPLPSPRSGPFFCFERPGYTDLIVEDATAAGAAALRAVKVLGSAQRRTCGRVLQHGSLILGRRYPSHPGGSLGDPSAEVVAAWIERFAGLVADALELRPRAADWTAAQLEDAAQRRERYAGAEWTRRR
jgi:hypothetical protein